MRFVYWVQGHTLKLKTTRLRWLHQSLRDGKHVKCPALLNELVFQLAYGYRFDEDQIEFATARLNPSQILNDIRHAGSHVEFNAKKDGYVEAGSGKRLWNLERRSFVVGCVAFAIWLLFIAGVVSLLFYPLGAVMLIVEAIVSFWLVVDMKRGLSSAQRLCALTPERIRPKRKKTARTEDATTGEPEIAQPSIQH